MQVPQVPTHPLKFDNGCQAPVLREALVANKPHLLKNFYVHKLYITHSNDVCIIGKERLRKQNLL